MHRFSEFIIEMKQGNMLPGGLVVYVCTHSSPGGLVVYVCTHSSPGGLVVCMCVCVYTL